MEDLVKGKCLVERADPIRRLTRGFGFMSHLNDRDWTRSKSIEIVPYGPSRLPVSD